MEKFVIQGGNRLEGTVHISGAKNSVVAILPAVLLSDGVCRIENVPNISDVSVTLKILYELGAKVRKINQSTFEIDPTNVSSYTISKEMSSRMRASTYFIGAMLGRFNKALVAPPGGCNFGVRPIDQHIKGFKALGARVVIDNEMLSAKATKLIGAPIYLDMASVGATINVMLAAVKAEGLTIIENAAREPHIVDLANFLNSMGADIMGAGTDVIKIHGVSQFKGVNYSIIPDQIEAGTYMAAVCATGGNIVIDNVIPKHLESITKKIVEIGAEVELYDESMRIVMNTKPKACKVKTMYHPKFPTDMQPQITALLSLADGTSSVTESVWASRFQYTDQLVSMGADICVEGNTAVVKGVNELVGASVSATDLRAGAALIIAGLAAKGTTEISNIGYIDRGYEDVVEKFSSLGANIKRIDIPDPIAFKEAL